MGGVGVCHPQVRCGPALVNHTISGQLRSKTDNKILKIQIVPSTRKINIVLGCGTGRSMREELTRSDQSVQVMFKLR